MLIFLLIGSISSVPVCKISWAAETEAEELVITAGQNKVIRLKGLDRVAVGDTKIADVSVMADGEQVLITAKKVGTTSLILWTAAGSESRAIRVVSGDPNKVLSEVQAIMGTVEGINARVVGDKVILEGNALTYDDFNKIARIIKMYPQVQSFVQMSPLARQSYVDQINDAMKKAGLVSVAARMAGKKIFLEGEVATKKELENAGLIAAALMENPKNDLINLVKMVASKTTIQLDVEFVEISTSDIKEIGINWGDALTVNADLSLGRMVGPGSTSFTGPLNIAANYSARLNLMKTNGKARTLAKPRLICASGQKATFLAGGELPIPLITAQSSSVQYKEFGIRLTFEPIANETTQEISTSLEIESSDIDDSTTVMGVPGFLTRRVTSSMSTQSGNTVALSGLISNNTSKNIDKMPGLGDIPVLGELFKSRKFNARDTELIVFVTPAIITTGGEKDKNLHESTQDKIEKTGEELKFKLMD